MEKINLDLLARIASQYYEKNQTQQQIAMEFGYSRSMISRLLTEAQKVGIVEVRVHYPLERCIDLEKELRSKLNLKTVHILARGTLNHEQMLRRLGALAARLVEELTSTSMILGVSWGTALREVTNSLRPGNYYGIKVVQLIGALDTADPELDGPDLARNLAKIFGGQYFTLPAPLIVDSETTRDALLNDQRLRRILGMIENMQMTLTGIGTLDRDQSGMVRAGYLSSANLAELANMEAVGDVCAIHFDKNGKILDIPLHQRRIGISPEQLRKIPIKIGVAGGEAKALPILGACRAGLINYLVTDEVAALKAIRAIDGDETA